MRSENNDKVANVGNVVEELAKRYELNENEQIVLATVLYRPENVTKSPMRCKAFSEVQVVHNMRTEPACNLPNFYRPFSRIKNNREDNSKKFWWRIRRRRLRNSYRASSFEENVEAANIAMGGIRNKQRFISKGMRTG